MQPPGRLLSQEELLKKISQDGVKYIVLDKWILTQNRVHWSARSRFSKVFDGGNILDNPYYHQWYRGDDFLILEAKTPAPI